MKIKYLKFYLSTPSYNMDCLIIYFICLVCIDISICIFRLIVGGYLNYLLKHKSLIYVYKRNGYLDWNLSRRNSYYCTCNLHRSLSLFQSRNLHYVHEQKTVFFPQKISIFGNTQYNYAALLRRWKSKYNKNASTKKKQQSKER